MTKKSCTLLIVRAIEKALLLTNQSMWMDLYSPIYHLHSALDEGRMQIC